METRCSSVVIWAIPHGGPIELFLNPASATRLVYQKAVVCAIL